MSNSRLISVATADDDRFAWISTTRSIANRVGEYQENSQEDLDRRLDQRLKETFPASDPVSVIVSRWL